MFRSDVPECALTPEQRGQGFSLEEDEDFLNLLYKGKVRAVFSAKGTTFTDIRTTADRIATTHIKIMPSKIGFRLAASVISSVT